MQKRKKIVGSMAAVFLLLIAALAGGIVLAEARLHLPRRPVPSTPKGYQEVEIRTSDGLALRAWFAEPQRTNGNAVILLHGITDNRSGMVGYADLLLPRGYAVLVPDARAHGASDGAIASYGLREAEDVHLWANWIFDRHRPGCLFGLGESYGGAILLQSLKREKRFCAVAAESAFADFRSAAFDQTAALLGGGTWLGRTLFRLPIEFALAYARLRYGLELTEASPRAAVASTRTRVLLIHGLNDTNIRPYNSRAIFAARPAFTQLWEVPGSGHCQARETAPQEFDRKLFAWFSTHTF